MNTVDWASIVAALGLGVISVFTRSFFFLVRSQWVLPHWLEEGLRYAPLAALAAVIGPEVLSNQGAIKPLLSYAQDAKIYGALTCVGYFVWRRGVLGSILSGTAVYLIVRLGFSG